MTNNYEIVEVKFAQAPQPKYYERAGDGSRVDFGENNSYPSFLNTLYRESPKHGAIIKGKATYIFGSGLNNLSGIRCNEFETWNDVLKKCILDDEKYGGYALQIVWNKAGQIASVYHLKFHKVRTNYDNSKFWVKDEWDVNRQSPLTAQEKKKERVYSAFGTSDRTGTQILYVKQDGDNNDVYPLPSYIQAINYIDADRLISQHILGMAKDGFVASKLINFNNGEPSSEAKKEIEKAITKKFTGADGKRFMLSFNKNAESQVQVTDLGTTQLTKEDFTNINNLVQQEIYAAHQITSPMLFGIKTEGQLGGRSELRDAYEIFKNTYVNERQRAHEEVFNGILSLSGLPGDRKIVPVEPIGFEFSTDIISQNMTKDEIREKLGLPEMDTTINENTAVINAINSLSPLVANKVLESMDANEIRSLVGLQAKAGGTSAPAIVDANGMPVTSGQGAVNDVLRRLSAREFQQLQRVVRDYMKGKINRQIATTLLKASYGLSDTEVIDFIGEESELQFSDENLIHHFAIEGESRQNFIVIKTEQFDRNKDLFPLQFAEQVELSKLEANILNLISKDKRITAEVIATVTKQSVELITELITKLTDAGYIKTNGDEKILAKPVKEITDTKPSTTQILIRYSYEGPQDDRNRPFCAKLLELDKFYSREDIEKISERVGYSVWDRRGGWWTQPDGTHSPSCRHRWQTNVVLRKK